MTLAEIKDPLGVRPSAVDLYSRSEQSETVISSFLHVVPSLPFQDLVPALLSSVPRGLLDRLSPQRGPAAGWSRDAKEVLNAVMSYWDAHFKRSALALPHR